jgi:hypothetical protein
VRCQPRNLGLIRHTPRPLKLAPCPPQHDTQLELPDIHPANHILIARPTRQPPGGHIIDTKPAICFPSHGDDLPYGVHKFSAEFDHLSAGRWEELCLLPQPVYLYTADKVRSKERSSRSPV